MITSEERDYCGKVKPFAGWSTRRVITGLGTATRGTDELFEGSSAKPRSGGHGGVRSYKVDCAGIDGE